MRRVLLVALLTLGLVVTSVGAAVGITNGQPDGENHPYVGLLVFDSAPGTPGWRCSGALISPTVVLTAGHCTDGAVAARVWFDEDVTYDNVPFPLYPYGGPGSGAIEGTPFTNPDYRSPDNPYGGGNGLPAFSYRDVGVVVLNVPVYMDEYAELPTAGQVDTLKNKTAIDFVGYGVQYQAQVPGNQLPQPPPYYRWTGPRVRLYAPSALVSGKFVHSAEYMRLALNPGGGTGGTCFGDSGGPDLLGGTSTVLAVNSYVTNVNCGGVGYSARVDVPEVLDWIGGFLAPMFYTTAGPLSEDQVGYILAHQHMFVEFGVEDPVAYLDSTPEEVYAVIGPLVEEAKALGYDVFVDPTMEGVGRRPDIVEYVADTAGLPTMMVTGFYWDPYLPDWVRTAPVEEITDWLLEELNNGVGDTDVPAGWIKLSQSWGGITADEMHVLEAACDAAQETGASIGSHILSGATALAVIDALEGFGCDASRFIWIHAPYTAFTEVDGIDYLLEAAERGAYISDDFIGSNFWAGWLGGANLNEWHLEVIQTLVDAGYEDQIIIGSDTGWFDPGNPAFVIEPYNQIMNSFLPDMVTAGFTPELIQKLMHDNPWNAYSR